MTKITPFRMLIVTIIFLNPSILFSKSNRSLEQVVYQHLRYQTVNCDSAAHYLRLVKGIIKNDDNKKLKVYNISTWYYANQEINSDSALHYANRAINYIEHADSSAIISQALTRKGFVHSKRREYKEAIYWLNKSIDYKADKFNFRLGEKKEHNGFTGLMNNEV